MLSAPHHSSMIAADWNEWFGWASYTDGHENLMPDPVMKL
jgi:hypothetical protein